MLGGGVVILVLFMIQLSVSLGATSQVAENDPLAAGQDFLRSMVSEAQQPIEDIGALTNAVSEVVNNEVRQVEARDAVIEKIKEGLAADAPADVGDDPADPDVGLDTTSEDSTLGDESEDGAAVDDDTEAWTYNDDVEEIQ